MLVRQTNLQEVVKASAIFIVSTALMFPGFLSNAWHVAPHPWFADQLRDTESLIIGRMVKSRQDGIFSAAALTGAGVEERVKREWITSEQVENQYAAYLDGLTFNEYWPYLSQTGGQGILFSLLDRALPLAPQKRLTLYHALTSMLTAIALSMIALWFYREFGSCVAGFVVGSMVISQWLTVFGRNLWWVPWAFYLPMIALMYVLRHSRRVATGRHLVRLGLIVGVCVWIKCFFTGFEYITTTLLMMSTPLVYYALLDRVRFREFLKAGAATVAGSMIAVFASLTVLLTQIAALNGSLSGGFEHLVYALGKRAHGHPSNYPEGYAASLDASTAEVVVTYLEGTFVDLNNYLAAVNPATSNEFLEIRYVYVVILFLTASIILSMLKPPSDTVQQRRRQTALIVTTWFSMLAPLSWYVVFTAHSYVHTHMNYLLWQMPFTLFGFALCGLVVGNVFSGSLRRTVRRTRLPSHADR